MTNAENQWKDIMEQECKTGDWAIDKYTNKVYPCCDCRQCLFFKEDQEGFLDCRKNKVDWLNAECESKFSEEDKAVMRALDKIEWVTRDITGMLCGFTERPLKSEGFWARQRSSTCRFLNFNKVTSAQFLPISWDDKEPTSRAEILGEE